MGKVSPLDFARRVAASVSRHVAMVVWGSCGCLPNRWHAQGRASEGHMRNQHYVMKREGQRTLGRSRSGRDANSREYSLRQTVMWNDSVTTNGVEMECRCNGCNDDSTRNAYLMPISPLTLSAPQAPESNAPLVASSPDLAAGRHVCDPADRLYP